MLYKESVVMKVRSVLSSDQLESYACARGVEVLSLSRRARRRLVCSRALAREPTGCLGPWVNHLRKEKRPDLLALLGRDWTRA